jgi:hypothetical protein
MRSCTHPATRLVSSSVIVYSDNCLCTLAFLRDPPMCIIGRLGGPISYGMDLEGVSCVVVSPTPCSPCVMEVSFFLACTSFFGALPLFCCVVFLLGFPYCVGLLGAVFPPTGVLGNLASIVRDLTHHVGRIIYFHVIKVNINKA